MSASSTLVSIGTPIALYALLALALNLKFGFTGILDFGHVAYYLVGAYTAALIVAVPASERRFQEYILGFDLPNRVIDGFNGLTGIEFEFIGGLGWAIAVVIGIIAAGFLGLVVALPAIRLREDYLAIALLGVAVIVQRIIQSETWIANGPDSLSGYPAPFEGLLPFPNTTVSGALLFGLTLFTVWSIMLVLAAREDRFERPEDGLISKVVHGGLAVTTLGVGYWAIRRAHHRKRTSDLPRVGPQIAPGHYIEVIIASVLIGILGAIGMYLDPGISMLLVFLGPILLASWIIVGTKVRSHYEGYTRREAAFGLGIALGFIIPIGPAYLLGGDESIIAWIASFTTFVLLGVYFSGLYLFSRHWERFGLKGSYMGLLGIGLLWLLAIRYFVVSLDGFDSQSIIDGTLANLLWLLELEGLFNVEMGYRRFRFVLVVSMVFIGYFLVEMIVKSPYGRVLRAVRDDENVALSLGKNTFAFKVQSMVIGSALAGMAGAFGAIYYGAMSYETFHPLITFFIFLAVILGGTANNKGVILGAVLYWLFVRGTVELAGMFPGPIEARMTVLRNAIIGLILMLILYYQPKGIWPEERFTLGVNDT